MQLKEVISYYSDIRDIHPACEAVPPMSVAEQGELTVDIRENGLNNPIVLTEKGSLLDGRHRLIACHETGTEPQFIKTDADPWIYACSQNVKRRNLTPSQTAMFGYAMMKAEQELAKERQAEAGIRGNKSRHQADSPVEELVPQPANRAPQARDIVAKIVGVNPRYIDMAKMVTEEAPELAKRVHLGEVGLKPAHREVVRLSQRRAVAARPRERLTADIGKGVFLTSMDTIVEAVAAGEHPPFRRLYVDPPWTYENTATRGSAASHYSTMSLSEICGLPIEKIVDDKCLLWMWVTNGHLYESEAIINAWGFEYKANMIWDKQRIGLGNFVRYQHEILLIGARGGELTSTRNQGSVVRAKRGTHSTKPRVFREIVERNSNSPRLELFGRQRSTGWVVFGNEETTTQLEWQLI